MNRSALAAGPRRAARPVHLPYRPRARPVRARISRLAGATLTIVGVAAIAGWLAGYSWLTRLSPEWAAMQMNTALCFTLLGVAFWLPGGVRDPAALRRTGRGSAALATLVAALTLCEYQFGIDLGIDQLLFQPPVNGGAAVAGRMSQGTAIGLTLIGCAALLIDWRTKNGIRPSLILAVLAGTLSLAAFIGYLYGAQSLYGISIYSSMALHTSAALLVASIGILGVHTDNGPLGILASTGRGSRLARTILPFAISLPVLIGWLRLQGDRNGYYDLEFGLALFATASILVFVTLIWLAAAALNREEVVEQRAAESREQAAIRRRVLFDQAADGIFVLDAAHNVVEVNSSLARMIGHAADDVAGMRAADWFADEALRTKLADGAAPDDRHPAVFASRLRRVDGTTLDVEVSCSAADLDGQQLQFFVCRDISARRQSEQALKASELRFRRALSNIPDVVVLYDSDLRIRYINNATRAVTGQTEEFFLGKRDEEVFAPEVTEKYMPALRETLSHRHTTVVECDIDLPGAGLRALRITCVPLLDADGNVREILGITRDLTEHRNHEQALRDSEAKHRQLIEQAADAIFISDADGNFELVNSRCCELLGYREEELLGLNGRVTFLNEETSINTARLQRLKSGDDIRYERMLRRKDGSLFPAEISLKLLDEGSTQVIFHDITERHEQEKRIQRLHRIRSVTSGINSAIVRIRDRKALLQEVSRIAVNEGRFCVGWIGVVHHDSGKLLMVAQSGLPQESGNAMLDHPVRLVPEGPSELAMLRQRPVFDNDIGRAAGATEIRTLAAGFGARSVISLPLIVAGKTFGVLVLYAVESNYFDDDEMRLLRELAADVSFGLEFIAQQERVDYLAYYDSMTGLPNRKQFFYRISRQLQDAKAAGLSTVLSLIDVNRFRMINETFGREDADGLIAEIAQRISNTVHEEATVARIGSNTFAVAVTESWNVAEAAHRLEERSKSVFGVPFRIGQETIHVTATTGVAVFPNDASRPEVLLANAEAALRNAKAASEQYLLYSPEMNARVAESIRLENRLRDALDNDELSLSYQPKVDALTGKLCGLEALMRWTDAETGKMIGPDRFIPVMESTGLILEAGRWALQQVGRDCQRWKEQGAVPPQVAVNVSPLQLEQKDFLDTVIDAHTAITEAGARLELEITETLIMKDVDGIIRKLQTLHGMGISISVDDFGTGYSSLNYIARLPINALKIDRSFIADLADRTDSLAIVKSIISLAKALQLLVIAEGVETEEQAMLLRELQCDELQGYYFGRPLPHDTTLEVIRALS